jgi:hypothetical protein
MSQNMSHLSDLLIDGVVIAWHTSLDIQAVKVRGVDGELLFIDGQQIKLNTSHVKAVQQVINMCSIKPCDLKNYIVKLKSAV